MVLIKYKNMLYYSFLDGQQIVKEMKRDDRNHPFSYVNGNKS